MPKSYFTEQAREEFTKSGLKIIGFADFVYPGIKQKVKPYVREGVNLVISAINEVVPAETQKLFGKISSGSTLTDEQCDELIENAAAELGRKVDIPYLEDVLPVPLSFMKELIEKHIFNLILHSVVRSATFEDALEDLLKK